MKEFLEKYKEVRVQTSREKVTSAQFSMAKNGGDPLNTMFMGSESLSRRQSQEARNRRESNTRRQDSQGRGYYRRYNRSQSYNYKTVEWMTFTENIPNQGQDTAHLIKVNQEIEDSMLSRPAKNKEKIIPLDVLHVHVALVRRED